jgi:hypothetical protein
MTICGHIPTNLCVTSKDTCNNCTEANSRKKPQLRRWMLFEKQYLHGFPAESVTNHQRLSGFAVVARLHRHVLIIPIETDAASAVGQWTTASGEMTRMKC